MTERNKYLVVIAGPTAVGKTALTIELAQQFETEIISSDSRQFYRELEIGTAKPSEQELTQAPHHFINSHSIFDDYDVGDFEREAIQKLHSLFQKHNIVLMTGGSGLYIKSVLDGLDEMPKASEALRNELNKLSIEELQHKLKSCDPDYYEQVDLNNPQRLVRAIEVFEASGKPFSSFRAKSRVERPFSAIKIMLNRDREELYRRIDQRMDLMIQNGLFEEAEKFKSEMHRYALQTVGYKEIFGFLDGKYDRDEAIRLLKRNTRRYAKRQLTWFRKDPEYHWFHPGQKKEIVELINSKIKV